MRCLTLKWSSCQAGILCEVSEKSQVASQSSLRQVLRLYSTLVWAYSLVNSQIWGLHLLAILTLHSQANEGLRYRLNCNSFVRLQNQCISTCMCRKTIIDQTILLLRKRHRSQFHTLPEPLTWSRSTAHFSEWKGQVKTFEKALKALLLRLSLIVESIHLQRDFSLESLQLYLQSKQPLPTSSCAKFSV